MAEPVLLKVARLDDGTVHEVVLEEGRYRAETFYSPTTEPINPQPCLGDLGPIPLQETMTLDPLEGATKQNIFRLIMTVIFGIQYIGLVAIILWPVSPYFVTVPKIKPENQLVPSRVLYLNPSKLQSACYDKFFCSNYDSMPIITTPHATFFPNFTDGSGRPVDYIAALYSAFNIMHNSSCSNYQFVTNQHLAAPHNSSKHWNATKIVVAHGLFLWKYDCHPEALELVRTIFPHARFGLDVSTYLPRAQPSPCLGTWETIKTQTYAPKFPDIGSNCTTLDDSDYLDDVVDEINFLE